MSSAFKTEELLQYVYGETSPLMTRLIEEASQKDVLLKEKIDALKLSMEGLNGILESPRPETVLNVLRYARDTAPAGSH